MLDGLKCEGFAKSKDFRILQSQLRGRVEEIAGDKTQWRKLAATSMANLTYLQ